MALEAIAVSPNGLDEYRMAGRPAKLWVGTVDGIVELSLSDDGWLESGRSLRGVHVSSMLVDAKRDVVYAGSHTHGLHRRRGGAAWEDVSTGLASRNVFCLAACDAGNHTILHAGTEPAYLCRTFDEGDNWEELTSLRDIPGRDSWDFPARPNVAHVKHVDFDPRDPQTFYVSIEQGALLKTTDGGRTFRQLQFRNDAYLYNNDAHRVIVSPFDPDEIYLAGGDGIVFSKDAGETWVQLTTPAMRVSYPDATFCSPEARDVLFTAGAGARPGDWRKTGNANAAMARSDDHGRTWMILPLPVLPGNIEAVTMVTWPGTYGFFVATTDGEVFESIDRGLNWSLIAAGLPAVSKCVHHTNVLTGRGAA